MRNVPCIIKKIGDSYLLEPISCDTCSGKTFKYSLGSAILTLAIGALSFLVAFGWNSFFQTWFEEKAKNERQLLASKLNYGFLVTAFAFLIIIALLYYVDGHKC